MSQDLAEIVHPLVDNGLYESAEAAVKDVMAGHILHQVEHYHNIVETSFAMTDDLHEHLGQLIAYARMNGVTPPWSK